MSTWRGCPSTRQPNGSTELAAHEYAAAAAHRAAERLDEGRATALAAAGLIEDADLARDTARGQAGEVAAAERRGDAIEATGRDEQWRERLAQRVERSGLTRDEAIGVARASRGNQWSVQAGTKSAVRRGRAAIGERRQRERAVER
ncbi:hypothetical protein [uncultured Aeromicrobium sp.]|uniref:hypothetical protein n=1 Tax=uncultured Aeromicrobium sp. TaxID=337820 RepID=UPI0025EF00B0|nr:hypothetical protein [uncultured Aeromicrobium sp.]